MFHQNAISQVTNILSGKPKDVEATTVGGVTDPRATWGLDKMQDVYAQGPTGYTGPTPGSQGYNPAQTQGYNILTGMQPGAVGAAVGNMTPQQIAAMNRSGGPAGGYMTPYQDRVDLVDQDMKSAMQMAGNTEGDLAQQYSSGGPSSVRSGLERWGAMGDIGLKAAQMKKGIRDDAFKNAMGWQREDEQDRIANLQNRNRESRMFGGLRSNVAQADINNQFGRSDRFTRTGQFDRGQENLARGFDYGEFNRMQNWAPNFLTGYNTGAGSVPWQTSQTQYGSAPSDLQNFGGMMMGLGGSAMMGGWKPFA